MRAFQKLMLSGALLLLAACAAKHPTVLKGDTGLRDAVVDHADGPGPAGRPAQRVRPGDRAIIFSATDRRLNENGERLSPQVIRQLKGRSVAQVIEDAKLLRAVASY